MGGGWVKTGTRLRFDILLGLSTDVRLEGGERRWGRRGVWVETGIHVGWGEMGEMGEKGCVGGNWYTCGMGGGGRWGRWGVWVETGIHVGWGGGGGGDGKRKNG